MSAGSRRSSESVRNMFAAIARRYDLANHLLSSGFDLYWRRRAALIVRQWAPHYLLDLAAGTGDLALTLKRACPDSTVVAVDFCEPMLAIARRKGVKNLVVADALHLPFADHCFDVVTVAFGLRNMSSWLAAINEMRRVVRVGGYLLILDFSVPPPPLRWFYRPYLHGLLPRLASLLTRQKRAYEYLAASIDDFPHGETMRLLLQEAGFAQAKCQPLSGGIVALYTARR